MNFFAGAAVALVGMALGALLAFAVMLAFDNDDSGKASTLGSAIATPTPCENFNQAAAIFAAPNTSALGDRGTRLLILFDRCLDYAK